jgi:hypothetical protein
VRKLSFTLSFLLWISFLFGQSPHGKGLVAECSLCHTTKGWKVDLKSVTFDHNLTNYKLVGQHKSVGCRFCHLSLEFSKTEHECKSCHSDLHENTLGPDCERCHTPKSWIIENISEIHRQSRFPLLGAHQITDCSACHKSGSLRRFDPLGIECIDCHRDIFMATTKPNHLASGYSTNCVECHSAGAEGWDAGNIEHSFFPLSGGHAISCNQCHLTGAFGKVPAECYSCHRKDFDATTNPNHSKINLSTNCLDCHTTNPGWKPAKFTEHDAQYFPIYAGRHSNVWDNCTTCHQQTSNYKIYTCIDCHEHAKTSMDKEHREERDYQYNSVACFTCHPRGDKGDRPTPGTSNMRPAKGHEPVLCSKCHANNSRRSVQYKVNLQ